MEMIQEGLRLDTFDPARASESYQKGADLLSRALEAGHPDPAVNEDMQQKLAQDAAEQARRIKAAEANNTKKSNRVEVAEVVSHKSKSKASITAHCHYWHSRVWFRVMGLSDGN